MFSVILSAVLDNAVVPTAGVVVFEVETPMCVIEFCRAVVKFTDVNNVVTVLDDTVVTTAGVLDIRVDTPVCVIEFCPKVVKFTIINYVDEVLIIIIIIIIQIFIGTKLNTWIPKRDKKNDGKGKCH